jgi:hypothetical protein
MFLEDIKERESPDAESRDEPAQGGHAPCQLMYIMEPPGQLHFSDSQHLL